MADLNILLKDASKFHNTSFTINDFEQDPRDYINKGIQKYSGHTFIVQENGEEKTVTIEKGEKESEHVFDAIKEEGKDNK